MFSVPINFKLTEEQFYQFYEFCRRNRDVIYDLYFTCRIPPFTQDAMGDIVSGDWFAAIDSALFIQSTLGIPISATFNNIEVRPTQENLDLFIQNFKPLYEIGVRSATIPHAHWVATGQLQKNFPELFIKNTILRNVYKASDVAKAAETGFMYVNLDRDIMRDRDELIKCKKVADKYGIKLALLANEGCLGGCPMMDEHFQFNNKRTKGPQYFNDAISRVSCPKWSVLDPATALKTASIPPWKEDWVELLQYVDVFKMHGRESPKMLFNTMEIIDRYQSNEKILYSDFEDYLEDTNLTKAIQAWRQFIKNCKFDCWDCNKCDKLYAAKSNAEAHPFVKAIINELIDSVDRKVVIDAPGLTSPRVQQLLNGISKHVKSYLEIGSAMGATILAIDPAVEKHCVDTWEEDVQPQNESFILPNNSREAFEENTSSVAKTVHHCDMLSVDRSKIKNIEMFFYDGPHDEQSTSAAVEYYKDCFADTCVLIFDDANWMNVVKGADDGVLKAGLIPIYSRLLLNEIEDPSMWWNGLYIMVVQK